MPSGTCTLAGSMVEASLTGVLKVLFMIILVFYLIRVVSRFALRYYVKKMQQKMEKEKYQRQKPGYKRKQQGDVTIEYRKGGQKSGKKKNDDGDDDYVDYEIVD